MKKNTIVATCGYGHSGSSAVFDLLSEFDEINLIQTEIDVLRYNGGLYS